MITLILLVKLHNTHTQNIDLPHIYIINILLIGNFIVNI